MRRFFLLLIACWILGVVFGVLDFAVALGVFVVLFGVLYKGRFQFGVACVLVCLLGFLYGGVSMASRLALQSCVIELPFKGVVEGVPSVGFSSVKFVVRDFSSGCGLYVTGDLSRIVRRGDVVEVDGSYQSVIEILDSSAGFAQYLIDRGVSGSVSFGVVTVIESASPVFSFWREGVGAMIDRIFLEPEAGIVKAMLLADRAKLSEEVVDVFRVDGVSHVLAISGLHISLLVGLLVFFVLFLPIPFYWRAVCVVVCIWAYVAMLGFPVSATRSGTFWTLFLLGRNLHKLISLSTVLVITALGMITYDPLVVRDVGFLLSFSAVGGIGLILFLFSNFPRASFLLVPIGATMFTWPIVAYVFGNFPVYGLIANLVVVPMASVFLLFALTSLVLASVALPLGFFTAYIVHMIWQVLFGFAGAVARLPFSSIEVSYLPFWVVWVYYVVLTGAMLTFAHFKGLSWRDLWE